MSKRKIAKLSLKVRASDDPTWDAANRSDAAEFDAGWTARQDFKALPTHSTRGYIAGWFAADTAWNARHQVAHGVYR